MERYTPHKFEESYMGKPGEQVYIRKTGRGERTIYHILNSKSHDMIDMFFSSEAEAQKYAVKKKLKVVSQRKESTEKDLNELIGKWKAQYGTKIEQVKKDKEFKKLSKSDKEYVEDEFNASGG